MLTLQVPPLHLSEQQSPLPEQVSPTLLQDTGAFVGDFVVGELVGCVVVGDIVGPEVGALVGDFVGNGVVGDRVGCFDTRRIM